MSDSFDSNGLSIKSLGDLVTELTADLQTIYGSDINVDSNSPDGQLINIIAQVAEDVRELLLQINSSFDPDQATGVVLDQRVALNGIKRNAGTYTFVDVEITVDASTSLVGLDSQIGELTPTVANLYTVKDDAGTQWYLATSVTLSTGTTACSFRAAEIGNVQTTADTITTPVTIVDGVTSINNPSGATSQGENEETDAALKIRRKKSTAIISTSFLDSLTAALETLSGVVYANVRENAEDAADSYGQPAHSIWCIVQGGSDADIANAIYAKKAPGTGMYGAVTYDITRANGTTYTVKFDREVDTDLYARFAIVLPGGSVDSSYIKAQVATNVTFSPGQDAVGDDLTYFLKTLNSNYRITSMELSSDGSTWTEVVLSTNPKNKFVLATSRITLL